MILSFANKETEQIWRGEWVKRWPPEVQVIARRKLRMLHASVTLKDLMIPPSNRLEKLKGDLKDYYSIRINKQWRLVFIWNDGYAEKVIIIDYH
jgi:proteic killer suppression protein